MLLHALITLSFSIKNLRKLGKAEDATNWLIWRRPLIHAIEEGTMILTWMISSDEKPGLKASSVNDVVLASSFSSNLSSSCVALPVRGVGESLPFATRDSFVLRRIQEP